jgi:FMN phosphatase YigB (HAD superfamily)
VRRGSLRDLGHLRTRRDLASNVSGRRAAEGRVLIPVLRRIGPRPGVVELLERLRPRTVVAVSDFEPAARLDALGLRSFFDRIYAAERHGALKPDPRVFEAVLADLRVPPSALLHVGNRADTDGDAARAAGCQALILGEDFPSFRELQHRLVP